MTFLCPDSQNGICTETRCGKCLVNPRQDGVDDNLQPTYTAACTFDGTLQYFHSLKPLPEDNQEKGLVDMRPQTINEAISRLNETEMLKRKTQWLAIRDLLNETGLTIPIEEWPTPGDWQSKNVDYIYKHLASQIQYAHNQILNEEFFIPPDDNWESLLSPIFSFDVGNFYLRPMESYEDCIFKSVELQDGSMVNICRSDDSAYLCFAPRDNCVYEIERYIWDGVRISRDIMSQSNRTWRKAKTLFDKHRTILSPQLPRVLEELGKLLHEARIDLVLDIEDYVQEHQEDKNDTALNQEGVESITIGKAYNFVKYASIRDGKIKMDVFDSKGKLVENFPFNITNKLQWIVIKQIITSDETCVKLDKSELEGQTISQIFKKGSALDGHKFYAYMRSSMEGPHSKWHIEQTPQKKKR